jgi:hypothetical protein
LLDFQVLAPDFMLLPAPERIDPPASTLGQILQPGGNESNLRNQFLASQVVPQTGTQVVFWQINDPDGDNFVSTFALRHRTLRPVRDLAFARRRLPHPAHHC